MSYISNSATALVPVKKDFLYSFIESLLTEAFTTEDNKSHVFIDTFLTGNILRVILNYETENFNQKDLLIIMNKFYSDLSKKHFQSKKKRIAVIVVKKLLDSMNGKVFCEIFSDNFAKFIIDIDLSGL